MSGVAKKLMGTTAAGGGFTAIEDVFSTYLYVGNQTARTITNGIDLAGEGGLTWITPRTVSAEHQFIDSERGVSPTSTPILISSLTNGQINRSGAVTAYNSDGFDLGTYDATNYTGRDMVSWTFRKAPRFFDVVTYTGTGAARTVDHNLGTTVGSIIIKRTDTTSNWAVYHRGNTAAPETDFLSLNLTNATADDATYWNDTAPTDSVFTVGTNSNVNASGGTYVAYLYAHDPLGPSGDGSDGLIACGSYTAADYTNAPDVNLGWEPQWLLVKNVTTAGNSWLLYDTMRGLPTGGNDSVLLTNSNGAEATPINYLDLTATGFKGANANSGSDTFIYIAIRRGPMRAPESGTEVYLPSTATGVVTTGFPVDLHIGATQAGLSTNHRFHDRLRGGIEELVSSSTAAETTVTDLLFDGNEGLRFSFGSGQVNHFFRRAPEFFDVVAYTGDGVAGRTVPHNLGVAPELMIVKRRNVIGSWATYNAASGATKYLYLNSNNGVATISTFWNDTEPTESVFTLGSSGAVNAESDTYIAYLFATLAGVSKVGSYSGTGGTNTQVIDCGFTSGARFVLLKRYNASGYNWQVFDTARGITVGNDAMLALNTTAAESVLNWGINPNSAGFEVTGNGLNETGGEWIFYAIA